MKLLQNATITFPDTENRYLDQDSYTGAKVVKNGSKVTMTIPREGRADLRLDRLTNATWTEKNGKEVVITGRSDHLRAVGLPVEEQTVTILAKGGECENCRQVKG